MFLLALMNAEKLARLDLEPSPFVAPKKQTYLVTLFGLFG